MLQLCRIYSMDLASYRDLVHVSHARSTCYQHSQSRQDANQGLVCSWVLQKLVRQPQHKLPALQ